MPDYSSFHFLLGTASGGPITDDNDESARGRIARATVLGTYANHLYRKVMQDAQESSKFKGVPFPAYSYSLEREKGTGRPLIVMPDADYVRAVRMYVGEKLPPGGGSNFVVSGTGLYGAAFKSLKLMLGKDGGADRQTLKLFLWRSMVVSQQGLLAGLPSNMAEKIHELGERFWGQAENNDKVKELARSVSESYPEPTLFQSRFCKTGRSFDVTVDDDTVDLFEFSDSFAKEYYDGMLEGRERAPRKDGDYYIEYNEGLMRTGLDVMARILRSAEVGNVSGENAVVSLGLCIGLDSESLREAMSSPEGCMPDAGGARLVQTRYTGD